MPRLIALVVFLAIFVIAFRAPVDTDTYWHLRAGQWQVEHRTWLYADQFSSLRIGQPWVNLHWLSQITMYGLYTLLADWGLALFTALLAVGGMAFIYPLLVGDAIQRAFIMVLAASTCALFWSARPQMASFFFSAVVVYLLWLYLKQGKDLLWIIPGLTILSVNMHPGFAIIFILLALALLGEAARWLLHVLTSSRPATDGGPTLRPVARLAVVGLVSAAAALVNPYGVNALLLPFRTLGFGVLRDFVQEWASPNFHETRTWPFALMLIGVPVGAAFSPRRLDLGDGIMLVGTALNALMAARNIPTFAIVAAPILSLHLESWLFDHHIRLNSARLPSKAIFIAANWLIVLLVVLSGAVKIASEFLPQHLAAARAEVFPVGAVRYLEDNHPPGQVFNSYNWGGYLMWAARDYPVYIDGRTDVYEDDFVRGFLRTYYAQPGWDRALDTQGINVVLVESSSPLAQVLALTGGWTKAYSDDLAIVYVRNHPLGKSNGG